MDDLEPKRRTIGSMLAGKGGAASGAASGEADGDGEAKTIGKPEELFPAISEDRLFPIEVAAFLIGVKSVCMTQIDLPSGKVVLSRIMEKISNTTAQIRWASSEKNGSIQFSLKKKIEHRSWKETVTQYTLFGPGGKLFTDDYEIVFNMEDGKRLDFNQWREWKEANNV